jgi:hypothetical protein
MMLTSWRKSSQVYWLNYSRKSRKALLRADLSAFGSLYLVQIKREKAQFSAEPSIINLASKNEGDTEKLVRDGVDKIDILKGPIAQLVSLREEIFKGLAGKTRTEFIHLDLLLKEISNKERIAEIRDVLNRAGEKRSDTVARQIEELNKTLDDKDISDLNELLAWVIYSFRPLTQDELEALLLMKNGPTEISLQPLSVVIRERHS